MRVVGVVQARCGSERLPNKVLEVLGGKRVIEHVLSAAGAAKLIDDVILATTQLPSDDVLEAIGNEVGVKVVRGSETDVLGRFIEAVTDIPADAVVRLTGDDPLLDPAVIDRVVGRFCEGDCDYASNMVERSWPRGLDTEIISRAALEQSHREATALEHREHVTLYVRTNSDRFRIANVIADDDERWPGLRLCIDTVEDRALLRKVFEALYVPGETIPVGKVVRWLRAHPEITRLNAQVQQRKVFGKEF